MLNNFKLSGWVIAADVAGLVMFIGTRIPADLQVDGEPLLLMLPLLAVAAMALWAHAWLSFSRRPPAPVAAPEPPHITIAITHDDVQFERDDEAVEQGAHRDPATPALEDDLQIADEGHWLSAPPVRRYRRSQPAKS